MIVIIEISRPLAKRPFYHKSRINRRIGWLWFAVSVYRMREDELLALSDTNALTWETT